MISLEQYRACIGNFNSRKFCIFAGGSNIDQFFDLHCVFVLIMICLILSGDIELNPGPGKREGTLSICHWNLNSMWVDDFCKLNQLSAFLNIHNFDIVCLGETFLN